MTAHASGETQCGLGCPCLTMYSQNTKHCEGEQCDHVPVRTLYFRIKMRIILMVKCNDCRKIFPMDKFLGKKKWELAKFHSTYRRSPCKNKRISPAVLTGRVGDIWTTIWTLLWSVLTLLLCLPLVHQCHGYNWAHDCHCHFSLRLTRYLDSITAASPAPKAMVHLCFCLRLKYTWVMCNKASDYKRKITSILKGTLKHCYRLPIIRTNGSSIDWILT